MMALSSESESDSNARVTVWVSVPLPAAPASPPLPPDVPGELALELPQAAENAELAAKSSAKMPTSKRLFFKLIPDKVNL